MRKRIPIALVATLGGAAHAETHGAKQEAEAHIARATELHKDGEFAQALDELKTAYALDPQPPLLFAMGQLHVQLGECTQAITYYERFLATSPARAQASQASQAIETCKTNPPPVEPVEPSRPADRPDATDTAPPSTLPPPHESQIAEPTPPPVPVVPVLATAIEEPRPWYRNYVADGLVGGGVVASVAGLLLYRSAVGMRADADALADYQDYAARIEGARSRRNLAIVLGAGGAVLLAAGGTYFFVSQRWARDRSVLVAPGEGGGVVSWSGRW